MSKHVAKVSRSRRKVLAVVGLLTMSASTTAITIGHADASTSDGKSTAGGTTSTRTFACPGRALQVSRTSASSADLNCQFGVSTVGRMLDDTGRNDTSAGTALPAGTAEGDLVVATLQTRATSTVSMTGWTKAYDAVSAPGGIRLSAWYRVASAADRAATATIAPASPVSMITAGFRGARLQQPVGFAAAASGVAAPVPGTNVNGGASVSTLGVEGRRPRVAVPTGTSGARLLANGAMRMAQVLRADGEGASTPSVWNARRIRTAVSGLLSVAPGPAAPVPAGAIALGAGARSSIDCGAGSLDYAAVSTTVVTVTCTTGAPSTQPSPPATTTSAPTTGPTAVPSPTTTATHSAPPSSTTTTSSTTPAPTTAPPSTTPAPTTTSQPPAPTSSSAKCTTPYFTTSAPNGGITDNGYYVHNNLWNAAKYPGTTGTMQVCSYRSWNETTYASNASGNGEVKTYPNVHKDYPSQPLISSFPKLTSTFGMIAPDAGIYDVGYDIWLNGVATSTSNEVMIWTQNHKQVPPGSPVATGLTFPGSYTGTWNLYQTNANHYLAFVPANGQVIPSGWIDVKSVLSYLATSGRIPSGSTMGALDYGVEVVDTGGSQVTFNCTDFSITDR